MSKRFDYDFIVIGGGVAGIRAAEQLVEVGRKVALVEQDKWGGSALNYTNIPQKALANFSHLYTQAIAGSRMGISSTNLRYNYPTVLHWKNKVVTKAAAKKALEEAGVTCIKGKAHFVGTYDVAVENHGQISANKFLIATGAVAKENGITGLETVPHLDVASAYAVEKPPKAVLVVGGGASGCEVAQYYAELGAKVVVVEKQKHLLPEEDEEIGQVVEQLFARRLGIKVFTDTKVIALEKDKISKRAVFLRGGQEKTVRVETIVIATGSVPNLDLGLENAGVKIGKNGVATDRTLATSARNIWVAGDVLGGDSSTEKAIYSAEIAAFNMLGRSKTLVNFDGFMRMVETDPQVAVVGQTEKELKSKKQKYRKALVPLSATTAALTSDFKIGFLKLMCDQQDKVLGASMVGPNAAEVLQEVALALRHNLSVLQLASAPHPNGEWTNLVRLAARKLLETKK